jgi:hypothetical protein
MPMIIPVNIGEESTTLYYLAVAGGGGGGSRLGGGGGAGEILVGTLPIIALTLAIGVAPGWCWWRCKIGSKCW